MPGLGALILSVLAQVLGARVLLWARGALNVPYRAFRCNMTSPWLQVRPPDRTGCLLLSLCVPGPGHRLKKQFKNDKNLCHTSLGARSSKYFRNLTFFRLLIVLVIFYVFLNAFYTRSRFKSFLTQNFDT